MRFYPICSIQKAQVMLTTLLMITYSINYALYEKDVQVKLNEYKFDSESYGDEPIILKSLALEAILT